MPRQPKMYVIEVDDDGCTKNYISYHVGERHKYCEDDYFEDDYIYLMNVCPQDQWSSRSLNSVSGEYKFVRIRKEDKNKKLNWRMIEEVSTYVYEDNYRIWCDVYGSVMYSVCLSERFDYNHAVVYNGQIVFCCSEIQIQDEKRRNNGVRQILYPCPYPYAD